MNAAKMSQRAHPRRLMRKARPRRFKKFVMIDRYGHPLWGTMATEAEDAQKLHDRFNPDPTGQGMGAELVKVEIILTK